MTPYVILTDNASQILVEEVTDDQVAEAVLRELQRIAEAPATRTEPSVAPPFRRDRLMANFRLEDSAGRPWHFVALLKRTEDEYGIVIHALRVGGPEYDPHA